ncbi:unnamed protein product [Callosobruchus maculatus]|uniref:Fatty acyl-CoA reductase n=2 Tax=Callosobruchus maculatus TaxID=64391 RepID=A0A653BGP4_CALMS|nr:unnamed protein product [Callosobruchus maculatus]VEN34711.1 unnamed protein product [Callosobruchus maculatus]
MFTRKIPSIPEYFSGKDIFLTGGTGFVGKVLIEKLLRSCPDVRTIYVLVRSKRGKTLKERREDIIKAELFDIIRKENPSNLDKVKCISGDVKKLKLGISEEDERLITSKVNIIYHVAASVRFDDPLREAIITNIRSTREIIQLALKCSKLEAFLHVSTAYCNVDNNFIEEKLYTSPVDWRDAIDLAESDMDLSVCTVKYMKPWPNTYTFTKRIAEHVTTELCKDKIPAIILRPSIIVHSEKEPMPGWIDNLNGPFALVVAGAIGVTSTFYARKDALLDFVTVDNVIKGMLIATWDKALSKDKSDISIYNVCSELLCKMSLFHEYHRECMDTVAFEKTMWRFTIRIVQCWYRYYLDTLFHVALDAAIDQILKMQGMKPRLLQLVRKIFIAQQALEFFMRNDFEFNTENFDQLDSKLLEDDKKAFRQLGRPKKGDDRLPFGIIGMKGVKRFIFKEREMSAEETATRGRRFLIMKYAFNYILLVIVIYFILVTWIL